MLRYGYFDSEITGYDEEGMPIFDRAETSDFLALFISKLISDGILAYPGDCFQVMAHEGMMLKIRPGAAFIKGRLAMDTQEYFFEISNAPSAYKRIDRVILRANYLQRCCEVVIREGVPGERPEAPELIRPDSGDYYELCLATVMINANQSFITQSSITDTRYDSRVCGIVTQMIDRIDTSVFYEQLQQFYEEYVDKANTEYQQFYEEYVDKANTEYQQFLDGASKNFQAWFQNIQEVLNSFENGSLLMEINNLLKDLYRMATDDDIDKIISGTYIDEDNEGSIFETGSNQDIDDIIDGTYADSGESETVPAEPETNTEELEEEV